MGGEHTTVLILLAMGFVAWLALKAFPVIIAAITL